MIDKKIISGINNLSGEWGHNPLPYYGISENMNVFQGTSIPDISVKNLYQEKDWRPYILKTLKKKYQQKKYFLTKRKIQNL